MKKELHFTSELFRFLKELKENNNRAWFEANKERYETRVRQPLLRFISDFAPLLYALSPCLVADPRPSGSMFRIYRDVRFSKDKSPYKTHAAAHFWHGDLGKNAHSPGFYLHLEPNSCFAAAGLWRPDASTLVKVRDGIVERPDDWKQLRRKLVIVGDTLNRPPKGYDPDHPFIEDLKFKDFVTSVSFRRQQVYSADFLRDFASACKKMSPLVEFISKALGLEW